MMQAAKDRTCDDLAEPLDRPRAGRILVERQMRPSVVVVGSIAGQDPTQMVSAEDNNMVSAEDNNMVEAFPANRADQPLGVPVLPG